MAGWILFDGMNLAFRCFHAVPELARSDGFPTNALHGWVRSLWRVQDEHRPEDAVVVFDFGEDPKKKELLPAYKENRKAMPEGLARQLPFLKESARLMGFRTVELFETEADDLIATLADRLAKEGRDVLIVSSDKDFAQLVNPRIRMLLPAAGPRSKGSGAILDERGIEEKYGVPPERIAELLALVGDSSDNIPGLAGVGPKTAAKWLREYGGLEGILAHAGSLEPKRFRQKVADGTPMLRRNLELTRLNPAVELPELEPAKCEPEKLYAILEQMEMKGVLGDARRRLGDSREPHPDSS